MDKYLNKLIDTEHPFRVTGGMIKSYYVCQRQLWFKMNRISLDDNNSKIVAGIQNENQTYRREDEQNIFIDSMISPDRIDEDSKIIYETKLSSGQQKSSLKQLQYYLYYLKKSRNKIYTGVLRIPSERTKISTELTPEVEEELETVIREIYDLKCLPVFKEKSVCKYCAYKSICWS